MLSVCIKSECVRLLSATAMAALAKDQVKVAHMGTMPSEIHRTLIETDQQVLRVSLRLREKVSQAIKPAALIHGPSGESNKDSVFRG